MIGVRPALRAGQTRSTSLRRPQIGVVTARRRPPKDWAALEATGCLARVGVTPRCGQEPVSVASWEPPARPRRRAG